MNFSIKATTAYKSSFSWFYSTCLHGSIRESGFFSNEISVFRVPHFHCGSVVDRDKKIWSMLAGYKFNTIYTDSNILFNFFFICNRFRFFFIFFFLLIFFVFFSLFIFFFTFWAISWFWSSFLFHVASCLFLKISSATKHILPSKTFFASHFDGQRVLFVIYRVYWYFLIQIIDQFFIILILLSQFI